MIGAPDSGLVELPFEKGREDDTVELAELILVDDSRLLIEVTEDVLIKDLDCPTAAIGESVRVV